MLALKAILGLLIFLFFTGMGIVWFALRNGVHVPTNEELIYSAKAYAYNRREAAKLQKKGPVKASDIRKLK